MQGEDRLRKVLGDGNRHGLRRTWLGLDDRGTRDRHGLLGKETDGDVSVQAGLGGRAYHPDFLALGVCCINIGGGIGERTGAAVEGDVVFACYNGAVCLGGTKLIGYQRVVHGASCHVGGETHAKGICTADRKGLFCVFYGNCRIAIGKVDLGSGAYIGGDICRTCAVDGSNDSILAVAIDLLDTDLVTEVTQYGQISAAVHHIDFIITGMSAIVLGIGICSLDYKDGGVRSRYGPFVHIYGSTCGYHPVGAGGKVCLARVRLVYTCSRWHIAGINGGKVVKGRVILIVHHEFSRSSIVGGHGALVGHVHDGKGIYGEVGSGGGVGYDRKLGEVADQRNEGHLVGYAVGIQVEVWVEYENGRIGVVARFVLVGIDSVVEKDSLPVCVLPARAGELGHNGGLVVEIKRFRAVGNQVYADP